MTAAPHIHTETDLTWRILALGVGVVIVLLALGAFRLWQDRIHALEDADRSALERAGTMSAGISATLQSGEVVLDFAVQAALEEYQNQKPNMAELPRKFVALANPLTFIQSVGFIAAPGSTSFTVLRDNNDTLVTRVSEVDFSKRDTFAFHAARLQPNNELFLSEVREGYVTGTPIVLISKGIWDDDDRFIGVAAVGIRVAAFRNIVSSVVPTVNGAVAVLRLDGKLLLSMPEGLDRLGRLPTQPQFYGGRLRAAPNIVYVTPTSSDGIERRIAYSVAANYPVAAVVSTPTSTALQSWTRAATVTAIAMGFATLIIGALTGWLIQGNRRQKEAQRQLQHSEQRFRDMLECSSDYIWETDADENVIAFEGTGTEFYPPIIGKFGGDFVAPTTQLNDMEKVLEHIRTRTPYRNLFIPAKGIDGELRWARTSANPKFDRGGRFMGFRGVGSDVTDLRRARQSGEEQRKTEALARLASGMAHEINNLLQPILIYSGFGSADQTGDARDGYFVKIRRAAESASHIVRNALSFTRRAQPHRNAVNLGQAVRDTLELMASQIPNDIVVKIDGAALDRWVLVDRTGLNQVLLNLFTNAIESLNSAPMSTRSIEVSATAEADVRLVIADNGPGIAPEHVPNVFDPFFTTKAQGQGTGLGLSVVSGLVRSWGGTISVTSKAFERTEFVIVLPVAQSQLQAAQ